MSAVDNNQDRLPPLSEIRRFSSATWCVLTERRRGPPNEHAQMIDCSHDANCHMLALQECLHARDPSLIIKFESKKEGKNPSSTRGYPYRTLLDVMTFLGIQFIFCAVSLGSGKVLCLLPRKSAWISWRFLRNGYPLVL